MIFRLSSLKYWNWILRTREVLKESISKEDAIKMFGDRKPIKQTDRRIGRRYDYHHLHKVILPTCVTRTTVPSHASYIKAVRY